MTWAVWRPAPGAACALLVGTGRHVRPSSLSRIPQAVTAVRALGAALSGEKGVFDVRRTTVVAEPADTRQVLDPLRRMVREPDVDLLLFSYCGHGLLGRDDRLCLALTPSSQYGGGGDPSPSLPFTEVASLMRESPARHKVAILDCCFSGRALGPDGHGIHLLTACGRTQKALFPPEGTLTGFTGELLRILDEGIPDGPRHLGLSALYDRLAVVLPTTPAPRTGIFPTGYPAPHQQTVDGSGHIALAVNPAHGTQRTPAGLRARGAFAQRLKKLTEPSPDTLVPDPASLPQLVHVLADLARDAAEVLGPLDDFSIDVRRNHAVMTGAAGSPEQAAALLSALVDALRAKSSSHRALPGAERALAHWSR
ncbi:caspase family protein [Streptomyces sp. NPDC059837]|uniref:caspase, EACC1-associated type n=1 Tax=unclassified Streptomyces TaxID=2593676 RepID=UPI002253B396|nr:caspase family protein [Streptomyces sp. NBC_00268]MCX5188189.1 caspase family protein [Streptomyces sp. NBC_00268]